MHRWHRANVLLLQDRLICRWRRAWISFRYQRESQRVKRMHFNYLGQMAVNSATIRIVLNARLRGTHLMLQILHGLSARLQAQPGS